jgi:hypothetical protein
MVSSQSIKTLFKVTNVGANIYNIMTILTNRLCGLEGVIKNRIFSKKLTRIAPNVILCKLWFTFLQTKAFFRPRTSPSVLLTYCVKTAIIAVVYI